MQIGELNAQVEDSLLGEKVVKAFTAEEMEIAPGDLCFIGDTLRDYDASVAADIRFIPFAPTEKKRNRFKTRIRELDIVSSYRDLLKLF